MPTRSIFVLGRGRLGSALARQARANGYRLAGTWSRRAARPLPARIDADLVALAVPEGALVDLVAEIAPRLGPRSIAFHLAGSIDLSSLRQLSDRGRDVGSLHPYCSISDARASLRGASCSIEGTPRARHELRRLALAVGLRPLVRPPRNRPRYHLSAGLLIAASLAAAARSERALLEAGLSLEEARRTMAGFLHSIARNLERLGPFASLTGPLARGERRRLDAHLALLAGDEPARRLYRAAINVLIAPTKPREALHKLGVARKPRPKRGGHPRSEHRKPTKSKLRSAATRLPDAARESAFAAAGLVRSFPKQRAKRGRR